MIFVLPSTHSWARGSVRGVRGIHCCDSLNSITIIISSFVGKCSVRVNLLNTSQSETGLFCCWPYAFLGGFVIIFFRIHNKNNGFRFVTSAMCVRESSQRARMPPQWFKEESSNNNNNWRIEARPIFFCGVYLPFWSFHPAANKHNQQSVVPTHNHPYPHHSLTHYSFNWNQVQVSVPDVRASVCIVLL